MTYFNARFILIMLAGLAGGLAEIFWIVMYSAVTHTGGFEISRQITAAVLPVLADSPIAPTLGVVIHLVLSVFLAFLCCTVFMEPVARRFGHAGILLASLVVLAGIWAVNFLVILPILNPAFVTLLPFLVTLASKLLFGGTMGTVLNLGYRNTVLGTRPH